MRNERVEKDGNYTKQSNVCAIIGFLLTLLNIVISPVLYVTGNFVTLFIFASVTAAVALILSICGVSNARVSGKGKVLSVIGIVINIAILIAAAVYATFLILFIQSCVGIFQGITPQ